MDASYVIKPGEIMLAVFFFYFVVFGSYIQDIFPKRLLSIIQTNIAIKHVLAYLTIFLFTYILGWYNDSALLMGKSRFENDHNVQIGTPTQLVGSSYNHSREVVKSVRHMKSHNAILTYALYSLVIYTIFILSSKCELSFLVIFLFMIIITFFIHLFRLYGELGEEYIPVELAMETGSAGILLIGFGLYFIRQYKDHYDSWDILTFLFGKII